MENKKHNAADEISRSPQAGISQIVNNVDLYGKFDYVVTSVIRICIS